jgi:hypothetical protein
MPKSKAKWTIECQEPWEMIKTWYMDGPILIRWTFYKFINLGVSNLSSIFWGVEIKMDILQ